MNYLIAYHLSSLEAIDNTYMKWVDNGIQTVVMAEVSSQAEALKRFLKDYQNDNGKRVQIVSMTKLEEETDEILMAWCYDHWAEWSDYGKEEK